MSTVHQAGLHYGYKDVSKILSYLLAAASILLAPPILLQ